MVRRHMLLAALGALAAATAGCGRAGGNTTPDSAVEDAAPDAADDAPETTITSGPMGNVTAGMQLTYTFTSPPGVSFECRVDAAVFDACTSPRSITALPGAHTFEVRAIDDDGDADP